MARRTPPPWRDTEPEDEPLAAFVQSVAGDSSSAARCPAPELVQASQMGTLPPEVQRRVAEHLDRCPICRVLVDALDHPSVGDLTDDEDARIRARIRAGVTSARTRSLPRRTWAAALVALLLGGAALFWQLRGAPSLQETFSALRLEKAAVRMPRDAGILWRGEDADALADLSRALEPYGADEYAEAARRLRDLVARRPESAAGHFYLGVSELLLGADSDAIASLETAEKLATGDGALASDTAWYLALAYQRTGQRERASARLVALCQGDSARAVQACAGARELAGDSPASAPR